MRRLRTAAIATLMAITLAVTATPAGAVAGFGDVENGAFYTNAVQWMVDNRITEGVTAECFEPYTPIDRGQAAVFMWRMEGKPTPSAPHGFTDVPGWMSNAVAWMVEQGITLGTSATTFSPGQTLTRAELVTFLWRLASRQAPSSNVHTFTDIVPGAFYYTAVLWAVGQGITKGTTDTTFSPGDTVTRGQVATFLYRYKGTPAVVVDPSSPRCGPPPTGEWNDPLAIGDTARVGDWDVAVTGFTADATAAVLAENIFNEPPTPGNVYALVRLRTTYRGSGEGSAFFELVAGLVGPDQIKYVDYNCDAIVPDDMFFAPTVFAGGTVEGNFCIDAPLAQINSSVLFVEPLFSFGDERVWWSRG